MLPEIAKEWIINLEYVEANCCEITLIEQGHTKGTARQPMI